MPNVRATPVPGSDGFPSAGRVSKIEFSPRRLLVFMDGGDSEFAVSFEAVLGFRVLDERDLMEFWPACSTPEGWLFEVSEGGWLSLEKSRGGFLSSSMGFAVREYLVTGEDECVSVLCDGKVPVVEHVRSNTSLGRSRDL